MSEKKETPEMLSAGDVTAVLEEADRFFLERGMMICPYSGIRIEVDAKDRYRAHFSLVALSRIRKRTREDMLAPIDGAQIAEAIFSSDRES